MGHPAVAVGRTLGEAGLAALEVFEEAVAAAARAIKAGEIELAIAGGAESMTRAPFVMGKAQVAFQSRGGSGRR